MVDITFLEVHVEAPPSMAETPAEDDDVAFEAAEGTTPPTEGGSSRAAVLAALVGLGFLAVVAYLARTRVLGDDNDELEHDGYD